jgi:acid phosphatase
MLRISQVTVISGQLSEKILGAWADGAGWVGYVEGGFGEELGMKLGRRRLVQSGVTMSAAAGLPAGAGADEAALNFVLIGDWGRMGRDHQTDVAVQMGKTAAAINSAFTVSIGDNFYENGVASVDDPQWQGSFEQIYTAPSLQTPWRVILGNHDYRGNVQAQLDYGQKSKRWQLPARYYQMTETLPGGAKADFFYLDTSPFIKKYIGTRTDISGQDTDAQLAWLDGALAASAAPWKIVIGHHPIYTALSDGDGYDHDQPDLIARLNPVLTKHAVPIYICGHDHCLQAVQMDGMTYIVNGAGSQTYQPQPAIRGGFASGAHGFMTVRLTATRLDLALIDRAGTTVYSQAITRT